MIHTLYTQLIASTYGSGNYNTLNFDGTNSTTGAGSSTGAGGSLTNTGVMIAVILGVAALILLIAFVVRIWKQPRKPSESESSE